MQTANVQIIKCICMSDTGFLFFANNTDPDQTPQFAASDQGLHCLCRHVCPNIKSKYRMLVLSQNNITSIHWFSYRGMKEPTNQTG